MAVNAYIYGRGIIRGASLGVNAAGDALVQEECKKAKYLYVTSPALVVPSAFPTLEGAESHHNDLVLTTAQSCGGYDKVIEATYEYGKGGEDDPWFTEPAEGDVRTTRVTYLEGTAVLDVHDDAYVIVRDKIMTEWSDDQHAGTEDKDTSNAEFVALIRAHVKAPHKGVYLVLDSATGGSSKALVEAFGAVRVLVPNPEGFELADAEVEALSAEEFFQERKVVKLAAVYLDFTCQPPKAARHLTEMLIHGWLFAGQLIAVTVNNRTRKAGFKDASLALFEAAVHPFFSFELLHYREYARMGFFVLRVA